MQRIILYIIENNNAWFNANMAIIPIVYACTRVIQALLIHYTMIKMACNECNLIIDIYQYKYEFSIIPFLI